MHLYFHDVHGLYKKNKMYISLYGTSSYISKRNDQALIVKSEGVGIVLQEKTIHDYEQGDRPYGGYSIGASAVLVKDHTGDVHSLAIPIYIPEVISLHVEGKLFLEEISEKYIEIKENYLKIKKNFQIKINEIFNENLIFGFVFGSVAKKTARFRTTRASDLDTFIFLRERRVEQEAFFKKWLVKFQWEYGLNPDFDYMSEIVTKNELKNIMSYLAQNPINLHSNDEKKFNAITYLSALAGKKLAVTGNKEALSILTQDANKEIKRLSRIFINTLESSPIINRKMLLNSFFNKKLYKSDLVTHLNNLHEKKDYLKIFINFVPLGDNKIPLVQDDQNYSIRSYYEKYPIENKKIGTHWV